MRTGSLRRAMACAGAVVGAGFASGREITVFFSRYGMHSWWLIALTVWAMGRLCMKQMENSSVGMGRGAEICVMVLLSIAGGAMASAGGQMIALLWNHEWAYSIAVVGTLLLAWLAGSCRTELFSWAGSVLSCLLICAIMAAMAAVPDDSGAVVLRSPSGGLLMAALKAAGYAAMNMTLAMDMVKRCARPDGVSNRHVSQCFAILMALLLCMSNALYLRCPQLHAEPFPIVRLLSAYGRSGFVISALLMYLAIFTTLVSVIGALGSAAARYTHNRTLQMAMALGLPLCLSAAGFSGIVDRMYAPAGWLCLLMIPAKNKSQQTQEILDKQALIQ